MNKRSANGYKVSVYKLAAINNYKPV